MSEPYALLVIGGGPAGLATARAYRAAGGDGAVALVTDEGRMPYNRPALTKELLRGTQSEAELPLEEEAWLEENRVALVLGRAVALDPEAHSVTLSGGRRLGWVKCVLGTGAEPTRIPIPGADHPAVITVRGIAEVRDLLGRLRAGEPVAVIGSGFIGCEIAASLRHRGHPVTLVSGEAAPNLERLGEAAAAELRGWLAGCGVELLLGTEADAVEHAEGSPVLLAGGRRIAAHLVVMATGVAPRGELAAAAGLELEDGAVVVDAGMRSSRSEILAVGDVASAYNETAGRRLRVEHWGDALGQGAVAGAVAAGQPTQWDELPGFWSTIGEQTLKYAAWGDGFDTVSFEPGAAGGFTAWYGRRGVLVGVLAHDADHDYERGRDLIRAAAPLGAERRTAGTTP